MEKVYVSLDFCKSEGLEREDGNVLLTFIKEYSLLLEYVFSDVYEDFSIINFHKLGEEVLPNKTYAGFVSAVLERFGCLAFHISSEKTPLREKELLQAFTDLYVGWQQLLTVKQEFAKRLRFGQMPARY